MHTTRSPVRAAVAGFALFLAAPASAADPPPLTPERAAAFRQKEVDNVNRAVGHVKTLPAGKRRFSADFLDRAERAAASGNLDSLAGAPGPIIVVGRKQEVVTLQSDYHRLAELGAALAAQNDHGNLVRTYTLAHRLAPAHVQSKFPAVATVATMPAAQVADVVRGLQYELAELDDPLLPPWVLQPPSEATCAAENGAENMTDRTGGVCAAYATGGIMRNISFPLRDDLTCVKNQAGRGTCVAFGTVAAMETGVHVLNGNKANLSEQHAYWYGETTVGFSGRYVDGLNTTDFVMELESSGYEVPKEKIWNYNPSQSRSALSGITYPNSCVGYAGEECTDFAFQSDELALPIGFGIVYLHPNPMPNAGAFEIASAVSLGTDAAGLSFAQAVLAAEIPLVAAIDVTTSFRNPDANGYVAYVAGETSSGGHAVHVAGWIANANLPAGAPSGSGGGYFVVKNSWGVGAGDCGYYYVPFDYLLDYGRSLTSVEVQ